MPSAPHLRLPSAPSLRCPLPPPSGALCPLPQVPSTLLLRCPPPPSPQVPLGTTSWELRAEGSRPNSTSRRPQAARSLGALGVNKAPPARAALADTTAARGRPQDAGRRTRAPNELLSRPRQVKAPGGENAQGGVRRLWPLLSGLGRRFNGRSPGRVSPSPPRATPGQVGTPPPLGRGWAGRVSVLRGPGPATRPGATGWAPPEPGPSGRRAPPAVRVPPRPAPEDVVRVGEQQPGGLQERLRGVLAELGHGRGRRAGRAAQRRRRCRRHARTRPSPAPRRPLPPRAARALSRRPGAPRPRSVRRAGEAEGEVKGEARRGGGAGGVAGRGGVVSRAGAGLQGLGRLGGAGALSPPAGGCLGALRFWTERNLVVRAQGASTRPGRGLDPPEQGALLKGIGRP